MDTSDLFTPYSEEQVRNARAYFENPDEDDGRVYEIPHWIGTVEARDRRIEELESLVKRQAAAHDDTLDRAEAAESRADRAVELLASVLRAAPLWRPSQHVPEEYEEEAAALEQMYRAIDAFLAPEKEDGR